MLQGLDLISDSLAEVINLGLFLTFFSNGYFLLKPNL